MPNRTCEAPDCAAATRSGSAQWCEKHYYRLRRTGRLTLVDRPQRDVCVVADCTTVARIIGGMCDTHHHRTVRHGSPNVVLYVKGDRAERHPSWLGDAVSYRGAHDRVRSQRGAAIDHECVGCGSRARHWSYNHTDANERSSKYGPYSVSPEHYSPRCVSCHKTFDLSRPTETHPGVIA